MIAVGKTVKFQSTRRGFTLVELLVVVLILATLMAVALPLYLSAVTDSAKKACRSNLQGITNAAMSWKTRTQATDFSTLTLSFLSVDMGAVPICPNGGTYSIASTGTMLDSSGNTVAIPTGGIGAQCSFPGHNGFIPGLMGK